MWKTLEEVPLCVVAAGWRAVCSSCMPCPVNSIISLLSENTHPLHFHSAGTSTCEPPGWCRADDDRLKAADLGIIETFVIKHPADMRHMDYGSDMDMFPDPTFSKCLCEFITAWWWRCFLWWSVWYLFCFRQVSTHILDQLSACMCMLKRSQQVTNI